MVFLLGFLLTLNLRFSVSKPMPQGNLDLGAESGTASPDCSPCEENCWLYQSDLVDCDYDNDGWTEESGDCGPWDATVNPGGTEGDDSLSCEEFFAGEGPCFDGVDNDCDGVGDGGDTGCRGCGGMSPIVVDTRGDGFHLLGLEAGVRFDLLGTGRPVRLGWIQGDDAFLVWDRNGNGRVDDGQEMFGNVTRLRSGARAPNGYEALKEYDENRDGLLDARDALFAQLRLWIDSNGNGETEAGELLPLPAMGLRALELTYRESRRRDRHGNELRYRAQIHGDRPTRTRFCYDVLLIWRGDG